MERERRPEERTRSAGHNTPGADAAPMPLPGAMLATVRDTLRQALSNDPEQFEKSVTQLSAQ
jgi:hypothetical protein